MLFLWLPARLYHFRFILILIQFLLTYKRPTEGVYFYFYFHFYCMHLCMSMCVWMYVCMCVSECSIFFLFSDFFTPWLAAKYIKSYLQSAEPNALAPCLHMYARVYVDGYMGVCSAHSHTHTHTHTNRYLQCCGSNIPTLPTTMTMMMQVIHAENEQQFWFTRQTTPATAKPTTTTSTTSTTTITTSYKQQ